MPNDLLSVICDKKEVINSSHAIGFLVSLHEALNHQEKSAEELWNNITLNDQNGTKAFHINQHKILALRNVVGYQVVPVSNNAVLLQLEELFCIAFPELEEEKAITRYFQNSQFSYQSFNNLLIKGLVRVKKDISGSNRDYIIDKFHPRHIQSEYNYSVQEMRSFITAVPELIIFTLGLPLLVFAIAWIILLVGKHITLLRYRNEHQNRTTTISELIKQLVTTS